MATEEGEEVVVDVDNIADAKQEEGPREQPAESKNILEDDNDNDDDDTMVSIPVVSWFTQLWFALRKNELLIRRKPLYVVLMLFSSVLSVALSWIVARDGDYDFGTVPLDQCGTVSFEYWYSQNYFNETDCVDLSCYDTSSSRGYDVPISYNEKWRNGYAVTLMSVGPFLFAICVYLMVETEIQSQMLGTLRALGLRESVYWCSWWIPFIVLGLLNAILGASMAAIIENVHAFQNVSFGSVTVSIFFLNFALTGASFLFAAIGGSTKISSALFILLMVFAVFIPQMVLGTKSSTPTDASDQNQYSSYMWTYGPSGIFWINANTSIGEAASCYFQDPENNSTRYYYPCNYTSCDKPMWEDSYASTYKVDSEREVVDADDYFTGCYFGAGFGSYLYSDMGWLAMVVLSSIPYTQFITMWGNFVGYSAMPGNEFSLDEFSMSAERLANESIGIRGPELGHTSLWSQGVSLVQNFYDSSIYNAGFPTEYNCPYANFTDGLCSSINPCKGSVESESITTSGMLGIQVLLGVFFWLLAAYWIQVMPGAGNGSRRKWYFPFLPSYWFGGARPKRRNVPEGGDGVSTESVTKIYGQNHAVDGVSMNLGVGQVTALLGHNGAGKTTMSHMLCCETLPSGGSASVFGLGVTDDPFVVRQLVGVCKQDDYLYPNLTAREHLELYGGLRGVRGERLGEIVQEWLESVDLHTVQNQNSAGFSGGMKRRLSVACSTIGERPFIILDEPTTGMDPVSRRFVWKHVDGIKNGRVILLTTHAMEEADLLADHVIIMKKGNIAAQGSPLELKAEHGSSLQFSLIAEQGSVQNIADLVRKKFAEYSEWVKIDAGGTGNVIVTIAKISEADGEGGVDVNALADFVSFLDSNESVKEYGFSNSSLEEVFLKVTEEDENEDGDDEDEEEEFAGCCAKEKARRARRRKRREARRERRANRGLKAAAMDENLMEEDETDGAEVIDDTLPAQVRGAADIGSFEPNLTLGGQLKAFAVFMMRRDWTGKTGIGNWILHVLGLLAVFIAGFSLADSKNQYPQFILSVFVLCFTIFTITTPLYHEKTSGLLYLIRSQGMLKGSYIISQVTYAFGATFCFALVVLSLLYATPTFRDTEICSQSSAISPPATRDCDWSFGDPYLVEYYNLEEIDWNDEYNGIPVQLWATRAPASYALMVGTIVAFTATMPGIILTALHLPGYKLAATLITFLVLFACAAAFIIYAVFTGRGDDELADCFHDLCNSTWTEFNYADSFSGEDFLNCAGKLASSSYVGGLCVPKSAALLPQYGLLQGIGLTWMGKVKLISEPAGYVENILMPRMSGDYCDGTTCEFPYARELWGETMGFTVLGGVLLFILGFVLISILTFPAGFVLSFQSSVKHAVHCLFHSCRRKSEEKGLEDEKTAEVAEEVVEEQRLVRTLVEPFVAGLSDTESMEETDGQNVTIPDHGAIPRDDIPPVLAYKLRKEYPTPRGVPTKVALKSLELQVPKGQVLGLLGKNGAGKTTALKIFAGAHDSTSGIALVAGYDIASEQLRVFERLGNCAQFDCIWAWQSIKTHLEFFGGLKGLPKDRVADIAFSVAQSVGLGAPEVYTRRAGALSGGMRRRLSIAISLIGAPSVLLLDEPTTGLDPSTRNSIWDLVNSFATEKRAIIITTHMMLEADTLCNRIAIMANGSLRTIGTQHWLKATYGSGYLLQLNLVHSSEESQNKAMAFVKTELHPDAFLQSRQAKTLHVALPRDAQLGTIFRTLYSSASREAGINQFLFSQSSLEDVFVALGE